MKMIILILKDSDSDAVTQALTSAQYRVTRIASTGGFLRSGVVTLLLGVRDERVEAALELIRGKLPPLPSGEKRATLFVVPVERYAPWGSLRDSRLVWRARAENLAAVTAGTDLSPGALRFLGLAGSPSPEQLEACALAPPSSRERETVHRRLIHHHLEKELKSARVLREMRHAR